MKMIAISKAPYITFHKVSRESVSTAVEHKALARVYEASLRVQKMIYAGDDLSAVSVCVGGRDITVELNHTGVVFDMRFQTIEASAPTGTDAGLFNRVR
jgi:acyl dehydratase